jgi:2,4-dienoyl-CoA reductase-like NADH-dependent reductase (Old Yellow Enzyme family)
MKATFQRMSYMALRATCISRFNYYRRQVSRDAVGYINTAGIYTDEQVEGWKKTKRVHDKGGKIFYPIVACRTYVSSRFS